MVACAAMVGAPARSSAGRAAARKDRPADPGWGLGARPGGARRRSGSSAGWRPR